METAEKISIVRPSKISKEVSSSELLNIISNDKSSIETIKFIPPVLGSDSMGYFYVEFEYGTTTK